MKSNSQMIVNANEELLNRIHQNENDKASVVNLIASGRIIITNDVGDKLVATKNENGAIFLRTPYDGIYSPLHLFQAIISMTK